MTQYLPLSLSGATLGERQRYLNLQVHQAATDLVSLQDIVNLPEKSPTDRFFKIDLANKLKNVDYIIKTLKDDDMLYVSRALKCKWLVEHRDIINPKYLENVLFPEMVMPAISKMKHWLYINLRNPLMCQQFYMYYKEIKFEFAIKFLSHCDKEFVFREFPEILSKVTPHYLKVFGEKYPNLVKMYFDALATNKALVKRYLENEEMYLKKIQCVLMSDSNIFLDIIEKYRKLNFSNKLSDSATEYILRFHKSRFMAKPELYVVGFLHIPTVAKCLTVDECQDVVLKLARAEYLSWWFSYKEVESLVKRVSHDKRAAFKKLVFVEKKVGEPVSEWPYKEPTSPIANDIDLDCQHVFQDQEYEPVRFRDLFGAEMMKKCGRSCNAMFCDYAADFCPVKSELQKLFDEFRFVGFEGTLHELKARIAGAKSADRRRDILLVLVSKSGGRADAVQALLQLALRLRNEPVHERAAIVRSLVKRASVWRLPQDTWDTMLEYAHGLGLDGSKPEAECREGLHAVVMRQLLATGDCEPAVRTSFLDKFSTLQEYKLIASERVTIAAGLQHILATAAADAKPEVAANYLGQLCDVLDNYHISYKSSQVVSAAAALVERDSEAARPLLIRLYEAGVGRRELLRQFLKFRYDDAALLNALRHDPDAISPEWLVKLLIDGKSHASQFFLKLYVYYSETDGSAEKIKKLLLEQIAKEPDVKLARPLVTLAGSDITSILNQQDAAGDKHHKLAAALRANMHCARPSPDAVALGWRKAGMKAVACRAVRCRPSQIKQLAQTLLEERAKRTVRLALMLAQRTDCVAELFSTAVKIRPLAALRAALLYFRSLGDKADLRIWATVKSFILSADLVSRQGLRHILRQHVDWVPKAIKPDYCAILYLALDKISGCNVDHVRENFMKCLPEVNNNLLEAVTLRTLESMDSTTPQSYPALVVRYLMLSKSNDDLQVRFDKIGDPFLEKLLTFHNAKPERRQNFFEDNVEQLMNSLQYNAAFFDVACQHCLPVIEKVITWFEKSFPKEIYFEQYVKIHATMLYYKAIRQSIKQKPEIFDDSEKKLTEGLDVVAHTFGRYVVKELAELKLKYFESIIDIYSEAFMQYLYDHISYVSLGENFVATIIKGMLSEDVGSEVRVTITIFENQYNIESSVREEIEKLMMKTNDKEMIFFTHAKIY